MNSVNFKIVKNSTKSFLRGFLFAFFYFAQLKVHALEIDMSRRGPASAPMAAPEVEVRKPSKNWFSTTSKPDVDKSDFVARKNDAEILKALKKAVLPTEASNEIVILNTETGFIPEKVQIRKGESYKVHIVNLNLREKNVSFLMDSFTQSHNTVYGVQKTFNIEPQVEGIFSYQCPETGIQGQMIVIPAPDERKPATAAVSSGSEQ